jgi:DNA-binding NarL/FixJ family response regulator
VADVTVPEDRPIRTVVVDDDPLVRAALTLMLGGAADVEVVAEAGDGREGLVEVRRTRPDVVLLDIRMPRMSGLEVLEALADDPLRTRVIVLTTFDADEHVVRALTAGAAGFLLKDTAPPEIVQAIRKVAAGQPMLSPAVTARLIRRVTQDAGSDREHRARALLDRLTDRERDVALAVGRGLSNADIAALLHMSVATVKAHVGRLFDKLEVENRVQLALVVHDARLT